MAKGGVAYTVPGPPRPGTDTGSRPATAAGSRPATASGSNMSRPCGTRLVRTCIFRNKDIEYIITISNKSIHFIVVPDKRTPFLVLCITLIRYRKLAVLSFKFPVQNPMNW